MYRRKFKAMEDELQCKVWEDKEIKFDVPHLQKRLRNGENILFTVHHVEDTKGNPGDIGKLLTTNLRIIWFSTNHKKYNLSVGFSKIITMTTKTVISKIRGSCPALYILAAGATTRFEFVFSDVSLDPKTRSAFTGLFDIYRLYQQTYLYREMKLRGAILQNSQLIILPDEQVYTQMHGVWNLSSDQGNLGSFIITNVRLVWFADLNETFNISLPFIQIGSIKIRDSKYGAALVIQTTETAGGYVLGFRIDPGEKLHEIYKELLSLHAVFCENPNFGVKYNVSEREAEEEMQSNQFSVGDYEEIDDQQDSELNSKLHSYIVGGAFGTGSSNQQREPVYCKELGFSIEKIRDGYTLQDLWNVTGKE